MSKTLQDSIQFARPFIQFESVNAGANYEPAMSIASIIRATFFNPPITWPSNREEIQFNTAVGTQDYDVQLSDLGFVEKVTLTDDAGESFEIKDVYNNSPLAPSTEQARPNAMAVQQTIISPDDSLPHASFRFLAVPDQIYAVKVIYQKKSNLFGPFAIFSVDDNDGTNTVYHGMFDPATFQTGQTATVIGCTTPANNGSFIVVACDAFTLTLANNAGVAETESDAFAANFSWDPIPDYYQDVFNNLFLSEAMSLYEDPRSQIYRQRGIAAFLSKASGLTAMQKNIFVQQWMARNIEQNAAAGLAQQGLQVRGQ
jgi:hypothetical protein